MSQMTSRERVLAALNHREPDRVPIDLGGMGMFTCWHEQTDAKVKQALGYDGPKPVLNAVISRTVRPDERIRARFQTDFFGLVTGRPLGWQFELHPDDEGGTWFVDEWHCTWRCPPDGYYYDIIDHPLKDATTVADIARFPWPDPCDSGRMHGLPELAKEVYETTDYALCFTPVWGTGVFLMGSLLLGWENHFVSILKSKRSCRRSMMP